MPFRVPQKKREERDDTRSAQEKRILTHDLRRVPHFISILGRFDTFPTLNSSGKKRSLPFSCILDCKTKKTSIVVMFILATVVDSIRIPAHMLSLPTLKALHNEIDLKYPNRVLMNVGLVICRYGDCLKITNGACVPGDGGSHHECLFRLLVFRPFVEEVCVGKIVKATADGIQVSLGGFFQDIRIPAYWMLRPSRYDERLGLWVWTPDYADDDDDGNDNDDHEGGTTTHADEKDEDGGDMEGPITVKSEANVDGNDVATGEQFEMELGAEIRFKIKSIEFTQITSTAKGIQATTTTTAHSHSMPNNSGGGKEQEGDGSNVDQPHPVVRKRSTSVDLSDYNNLPASMQIVASICEDGLGLTSWWTTQEQEE